MSTASSMIFTALVLNGERGIGGSFSTAEGAYYLDRLNAMLDSWGLERLMCYQTLQESFALTASTVSYTIGPGATFSTVRPTRIVDPCFIRDSKNLDSPVRIINADAYAGEVQKTAGLSYPTYLYYDQAFDASGYGTIFLYPAPAASLTLFINSWKQLQSFSTISVSTSLPPGYQRAIEYNLSIELAGGFKSVSPEVIKIAKESKANVKGVNLPSPIMKLDYAVSRVGSNIFTGN